jgi:hypothetical protein
MEINDLAEAITPETAKSRSFLPGGGQALPIMGERACR